ncbi:hypothetical protein D9M72_436750 [compost metagenome]
MLHQVADPRCDGGPACLEAEDDDGRTAGDHGDDGHDLDQREPELQLPEHLDAEQVQGGQEEDDGQDPDPPLHVRKPETHVDTEGRDIGDGDDRHFKHIRPSGHEPGQGAEITAGVLAEGAGYGVPHGHLAECPHHHEHGGAADHVSQEDRRAGLLDGGG